MNLWQMQQAKAHLSEVVKRAQQEGPQAITSHGQSVAVLLSRQDFDQLTSTHLSLVDFIKNSPFYGTEDLVIERDKSTTRDIDL